MKTISNLAGVAVGLFLMGTLLVVQSNYHKSFGGAQAVVASEDTASIAASPPSYETIALK